ncbi:restriction endonuclease subunit S [Prosthecobacter vanneervenii]|uniref:Type I restriction enzyme S subunit n=1 Tax=Prosthecobacter vanneervenii TaxID=48466 RepID=A0A7W8DKE3_9BACT|nr:restriction endonuclease subunit S [Prosthecobacter vanneervenii]MBB5033123.1 type I restriction enzyme S subunit [Prosthecobacter vanneervenii]
MKAEAAKWRRVPVVELCEKHVDCVNRTAPVLSEPTPFKMIRTTNVRNGYIDTENVRYVSEATYKKWTRRLVPKRGDVILTREAPLGDVGKLRTDDHIFLGQRLYHFRPHPDKLDADFLLYALMAPDLQGQIKGFGSGSTVEHMRLGDIPNLEINVPTLSVQRRIAGILSAYDELIENSQRRIRLLENMARALYREWFVHFRFPGHESVPRIPSALGDIPQSWEVKKLGEVASITMGLSPKSDTYNEDGDGTPLVNGPVEFGERFTKQVKWTTAPTKLCHEGDLVVCVRGSTTGKYVKSDGTYCLGRGVCGMSGKHQAYVDLLFISELPRLLGQTSGSTFPSWTGPQLQAHPVLSPPSKILQRFEEIVKPMSATIATYERRIENLRRTRDLLLPRLLSRIECS